MLYLDALSKRLVNLRVKSSLVLKYGKTPPFWSFKLKILLEMKDFDETPSLYCRRSSWPRPK